MKINLKIKQVIGVGLVFLCFSIVLTIFQTSLVNVHAVTSPSLFTFSAGGDLGGNSSTTATLNLINSTGTNFHLLLGDLSYGEIAPESAWCNYVKSHITSGMPLEVVAGNHEDGGETTGQGLIENFANCMPDKMNSVGTYGKEYYFDYPSTAPAARFIMVSPALTFTNGGAYNYTVGSTHYNWLSSAIDDARAKNIKWVVVGMHKVCLSMGYEPCTIGNDIMNLLVSKKVDLVLQGHDHTYQRSKQLALNTATCPSIQAETYNSKCVVNAGTTGQYVKGAGTIFMIIGTEGRSLSNVNTGDGDINYFAKWMGNNASATFGFNKFSLSQDQLTAVSSFNGSTSPSSFSDSFTIAAPANTPTLGNATSTPAVSATPTSMPATITPTSTPTNAPTVTPTNTPTPTTGTTTNIDNHVVGTGINQWSYTGTWSTCTGCDSWDKTINNYALLYFQGTKVAYRASVGGVNGIVAVSIDGGPETMVDDYAPSTTDNKLMWTSPTLANNTHTLRIRVTGTKNTYSGDTYASVFSADVTN